MIQSTTLLVLDRIPVWDVASIIAEYCVEGYSIFRVLKFLRFAMVASICQIKRIATGRSSHLRCAQNLEKDQDRVVSLESDGLARTILGSCQI